MSKLIGVIVRLVRAGKQVYAKRWSFCVLFGIVFSGSVGALAAFDLLPNTGTPEARTATSMITQSAREPSVAATIELPIKIEIQKIGLSATIENPTATKVEVLDQSLLRGAVRYPSSAKLGESGNVVLFGHSSYLPIVNNQAYKTFNSIQKLVAGDTVAVYSTSTVYTYRVRSFTKESAAGNAGIPLQVSGRVLTLATCDSFGKKTDRFVVTADFVESHPAS